MALEWLYTLISVILVSLLSLIGIVTISINESISRRAVFVLVSVAVGALFGDAFIHLLPEAFSKSDGQVETSLFVMAFAFFILEKFLRWRHAHILDQSNPVLPVGSMILVGDGLHNLFDGMLIAASYLVSLPLGIATTIAVILHELPQEIGDFAVLLHAGYSRSKALLFNLLSASFAIVGAIIGLIVGAGVEDFSVIMLPLTAGGFIYIAGSDLVPELQKERKPSQSLLQIVAMGTGVGLMLLLLLLD